MTTSTIHLTVSQLCDLYPATSTLRSLNAAVADGWTISQYNSPVDVGAEGLTPEQATQVIAEDPGLVYLHRTVSTAPVATIARFERSGTLPHGANAFAAAGAAGCEAGTAWARVHRARGAGDGDWFDEVPELASLKDLILRRSYSQLEYRVYALEFRVAYAHGFGRPFDPKPDYEEMGIDTAVRRMEPQPLLAVSH